MNTGLAALGNEIFCDCLPPYSESVSIKKATSNGV